MKQHWPRSIAGLLIPALLVLQLGGCVRHQTLHPYDAGAQGLVGEEIRVTTTDGVRHEFVLQEISETHLLGETARIALDEVLTIEHSNVDIGTTALLLGGVVGATLLFVYIGLGGSNP